VWDARTGTLVAELIGHGNSVNSASFSADGERVVTASDDKTARVWDARTGAPVAILIGHTGIVETASFSTDGTRIVTASQDTTARVWDAKTGAPVAELKWHKHSVRSASFSLDGTRIVTASQDNTARVWDSRMRPTEIDAEEFRYRLAITRPRPVLHMMEAKRLASIDPYTAACQRSFESHARGVLANEAGDFNVAQAFFLQAALLEP
jgi:predicted oxidoreductase (fatty acid repression mutant protein)